MEIFVGRYRALPIPSLLPLSRHTIPQYWAWVYGYKDVGGRDEVPSARPADRSRRATGHSRGARHRVRGARRTCLRSRLDHHHLHTTAGGGTFLYHHQHHLESDTTGGRTPLRVRPEYTQGERHAERQLSSATLPLPPVFGDGDELLRIATHRRPHSRWAIYRTLSTQTKATTCSTAGKQSLRLSM